MTFSDVAKTMQSTVKKINVRPFDRFILGPFLIWYGTQSKGMSDVARTIIVSSGIYQIVYNLEEYKRIIKPIKEGNASEVYHVVTTPEGARNESQLISNSNF